MQSEKVFIGTSGWSYQHWVGVFYPEQLPRVDWLRFYSKTFSSVEINSSFYRLPGEVTCSNWHEAVPTGFIFAAKASRYISHIKRLKDSSDAVERFIGRLSVLCDCLGPVLFQLPPRWKINRERLDEFISTLPSGLEFVFEFRNNSWFTEEIFNLLERKKIGFCIHDLPEVDCPEMVTSSFAYVRFHGAGTIYGGKYSKSVLASWAKRIDKFQAQGYKVYVYFNNDTCGYAVQNAKELKEMLRWKGERNG